jgi:hypothetical protein
MYLTRLFPKQVITDDFWLVCYDAMWLGVWVFFSGSLVQDSCVDGCRLLYKML